MEPQADSVLQKEQTHILQPEQGWSLVPQSQGGAMSSFRIAANSGSMPQINQSQMAKMAQMKSQFDQLGKALDSGDLTAAKQAYSAIQQNAPQGVGDQGPMAQMKSKIDQLGQALDSGDLSAAKKAYSAIQQSAPQGMPKGAPPMGGGAPPSAGGTKSASGANSSGSSTSTDPMDLNGDGTVSAAERLIYSFRHPDLTKKDSEGTKALERAQDAGSTQAKTKVDTYA
jgi:soluble cytochrome b562